MSKSKASSAYVDLWKIYLPSVGVFGSCVADTWMTTPLTDVHEILTNAVPGSVLAKRHGRFLRLDVSFLRRFGLGTTLRRLQELKEQDWTKPTVIRPPSKGPRSGPIKSRLKISLQLVSSPCLRQNVCVGFQSSVRCDTMIFLMVCVSIALTVITDLVAVRSDRRWKQNSTRTIHPTTN